MVICKSDWLIDWLIDWLNRVLRHIDNISAMLRWPHLYVSVCVSVSKEYIDSFLDYLFAFIIKYHTDIYISDLSICQFAFSEMKFFLPSRVFDFNVESQQYDSYIGPLNSLQSNYRIMPIQRNKRELTLGNKRSRN